MIGTRLEGGLLVTGQLGKGSYGTVYSARREVDDVLVAVKVLHAQLVAGPLGAEVRARFDREGDVLEELRHPHSVTALGRGHTSDDVPFLVLPLLVGRSLGQRLRVDGPLAAPRVRRIGLQILAAMGAWHARGVLHRDLKPDNVHLLDRAEDHAVVMDFGLAHVTAGEASIQTLTGSGVILGTPAYMAPEQVRGDRPTPAVDVYAFGALLFEALTGAPPFTGPAALPILMKQLHEPPPALVVPGLGPRAAGQWQSLVHRLLAKAPDERPAAAEVAAELGDLPTGQVPGA